MVKVAYRCLSNYLPFNAVKHTAMQHNYTVVTSKNWESLANPVCRPDTVDEAELAPFGTPSVSISMACALIDCDFMSGLILLLLIPVAAKPLRLTSLHGKPSSLVNHSDACALQRIPD